MQIKFLDLKKVNERFRGELDAAVQRVLDSGWYLLGKEVEKFEADFAAYCGVKHCIGVANGLDALNLIIKAYGFGLGDEIIVPANTFIASILAISENGCTPVLVEPKWSTRLMDEALIEQAITPRTKAIMVVHLYGRAMNMTKVWEIAKKHNLKSIEERADPVIEIQSAERLTQLPDVNSEVNIVSLGKKAKVLKNDEKGNRVFVSAGAVRMWVDLGDLCAVVNTRRENVRKPRTVTGVTSRENRSVPGEIDIRGMASDEAIIELDRYIDNAVLSGITDIRIIHGKGTGVLRKAVQEHLKRHKNIESYRLGVFGEGEAGVTVAQIKG